MPTRPTSLKPVARRPPAGQTTARGRRPVRRAPPGAVRRPQGARAYQLQAQTQLRRFRQGSALAVALTGLLLLVWGSPPAEGQPTTDPNAAAADPAKDVAVVELPKDPGAAVDEAATTISELAFSFYAFVPKLVVVLVLLAAAMLLARLVRKLLSRTLGNWQRKEAASAVARLVIYLLTGVAAVSVLAGDSRAVVGSVGLFGLAASWALQTPIESFTGWLLNSFRGYYRVGDRIAVGDVFGDVYRIDVLTTTVWEAGGTGKPVRAAQATGALITFPNWEVLRSNVTNYSRDFPYVWDEVTFNVANESDLGYTAQVIEEAARRVLGEDMAQAAEQYEQLLAAERLKFGVDEVPRVYVSLAESWTDCTLRYLVPVRTRRAWSSTLIVTIAAELARAEHADRIINVYPRSEILLRRRWPSPPDPSVPDEGG
jgi:small conductance mechanosensitive channel